MSAYLKEVYQDMKSEALKMLSDKKQKIEKDAGIQVEIRAVIGYPSDKIVEYVRDHRIDLEPIPKILTSYAFLFDQ